MIRILVTILFCVLMIACTNDDANYCYKGHDTTYTQGGIVYATRICDEWRNPMGKYPAQPASEPK